MSDLILISISIAILFLLGFILGWACKLDSERRRENRMANIMKSIIRCELNAIETSPHMLVRVSRSKRGTFKKTK